MELTLETNWGINLNCKHICARAAQVYNDETKEEFKDFVVDKDGALTEYKNKTQAYIEIPEGIKVIKSRAFSGCKASVIVIPAGIENIESNAFKSLNENTWLLLRGSVKKCRIGNGFCGLNYMSDIDNLLESKRQEFLDNKTKESFNYIKKLSDIGYSVAQCLLADCYCFGNGIVFGVASKKDKKKAFKLYYSAAQKGVVEAMYNLGRCYDSDIGVKRNAKEAVKWFREAANKGHAKAMCTLGCCYDIGSGVIKNPKEAVMWFERAADKGDAFAMYFLYTNYLQGRGVKKNSEEAEKWIKKAKENGFNGQL
ncbi:MAG: leucine-rich repeat protein [Muribaculaceae bacterium]|nr:leucine-rich repeat protein [Muribaculaceae bacterium]MCM1440385.1 leucine-rich repeat protein [Roseburia sp.]